MNPQPPQKRVLVLSLRTRRSAILAALGMAALGGLLPLAATTLSDELAVMLLYFGRPVDQWRAMTPVSCTPWLREVGFANSPQTCEDALRAQVDHHTATTSAGRRAHFVISNEPQMGSQSVDGTTSASLTPQAPIWLHIHGLNGNYLHGLRYLDAAKRLGFRLISAEYVNHGLSDYDGKGAAYGCKEAEDVVAVTSAVLHKYPSSDILLTASSMGTMAVALAEAQLAAIDGHHQIVAIALENPPTNVRDLVATVEPGSFLPGTLVDLTLRRAEQQSGYDFAQCSPLKAYGTFSHPTLIQHAKTDNLTPYAMGEKVYATLPTRIPSQLRLYSEGAHSAVWNAQPQEFEEDLMAMFEEGRAWRNTLARAPAAQQGSLARQD